ncbi:serine/threonine protein kinase [Glycocaulis sp.]|uniref:serine/threonine protein kinase n=1 Tax=Glycocaulis sp. TaxID=1969725 RepID=UPI003D21F73B
MWTSRWKVDDQAGKSQAGGQGVVRRVCRIDGSEVGALKELHPEAQTQTVRRFRFLQEALSLRALHETDGAPRLLDTNVEDWEDKSINLYLIMEWIEGVSLSDAKPFNATNALYAFESIINTIEKCHSLGLIHRDIKPDNVILQDGKQNKPILVDFGLSWQPNEVENGINTPAGQELGNRFLRLPEFAPGSEHRDSRSDLTLAVGLLYFMLTRRAPRVLADPHGKLPHEANAPPHNITADDQWPLIRRILDVGFQPTLINRFQNTMQITNLIKTYRSRGIDTASDNLQRELDELQSIISSSVGRAQEATANIMKSGSHAFLETIQQSIAPDLICGGTGPNVINTGLAAVRCDLDFFALRPQTMSPKATFLHTVSSNQGRIAASASVEGSELQVYYEGPLMDREGFIDAAKNKGREIAVSVVRAMRTKLSKAE